MLEVIRSGDRSRLAELLAQMHRDRKRVFVERLGWQMPVVEGEYEIDQFDGEQAVYLVVRDAAGRHAGSLRLLPTMGPHLLSEVFPHLCEHGVPRGPDIWEITRLCTAPGLIDPRAVRQQLLLGVVEFALRHGIRRYTCVTHVPFLSALLAVGWDCAPLGLPREQDGVTIGALAIDVNEQTLRLVRKRVGGAPSGLEEGAPNAA